MKPSGIQAAGGRHDVVACAQSPAVRAALAVGAVFLFSLARPVVAEDRKAPVHGEVCVSVPGADDPGSRFNCLNAELVRSVNEQGDRAQLQQFAAGTPAAVPANQPGLFNQSAIKQTLGSNFGHSAHPARPVQSGGASPVIHRIP